MASKELDKSSGSFIGHQRLTLGMVFDFRIFLKTQQQQKKHNQHTHTHTQVKVRVKNPNKSLIHSYRSYFTMFG